MKYIAIDENKLIRLYKKGLSLKKLETVFNVSQETLERRLVKRGIHVRSVKESMKYYKRHHIKITEKDVKDIIRSYTKKNSRVKDLAIKYGMTDKGILYVLHKHSAKIRPIGSDNRTYRVKENIFDNIDTQKKAYFLGLLMSDGYNNEKKGQIEVTQSDKDVDIIVKLRDFVFVNKDSPIKRYIRESNAYTDKISVRNVVNIHSKKLSNYLAKNGCVKNKTNVVKFPEHIPKKLYRHFIRGYIDGDGCIHLSETKKSSIAVSITGTKNFVQVIAKYIKRKLNLNSSIVTEHRCKEHIKKISIGGRLVCLRFLNWIYVGATIYGNRKHAKYLRIKSLKIIKGKICEP